MCLQSFGTTVLVDIVADAGIPYPDEIRNNSFIFQMHTIEISGTGDG